ncbi:unnamed protein product [Paramecium sonneborni]|uniref:Uncharacterized protein n=1 Tax=Paramecium sonneborni TaxID=65129 RepID=A0A8S1L0T6_9CILI|nr:unnamed protein product [Paramecium sonneborni]
MLIFKTKNLEPPFKMSIIENDSPSFIQFKNHQHFQKPSSQDFGIKTKQNLSLSQQIENKHEKVEDKLDIQKTQRVKRQVFDANLNQTQEIGQQAHSFIPRLLSKKIALRQSQRNKSQNFQYHHCEQYPLLPFIKIQKVKQFQKSDQQPSILKSKNVSNQNHLKTCQRNKTRMRENLIILKIVDNLQESTILLEL